MCNLRKEDKAKRQCVMCNLRKQDKAETKCKFVTCRKTETMCNLQKEDKARKRDVHVLIKVNECKTGLNIYFELQQQSRKLLVEQQNGTARYLCIYFIIIT